MWPSIRDDFRRGCRVSAAPIPGRAQGSARKMGSACRADCVDRFCRTETSAKSGLMRPPCRPVPSWNKDGAIVLYDIYVTTTGAPTWIGSRRTLEQCRDSFDAYFRSL